MSKEITNQVFKAMTTDKSYILNDQFNETTTVAMIPNNLLRHLGNEKYIRNYYRVTSVVITKLGYDVFITLKSGGSERSYTISDSSKLKELYEYIENHTLRF